MLAVWLFRVCPGALIMVGFVAVHLPVGASDDDYLEPGILVDVGQFDQFDTPCLTVAHHGFDGFAEYRDGDGRVLARAGSWLGRDSRYLLRPLRTGEQSVVIRPFGDRTLAPSDVEIEPCPGELSSASVDAFTTAQNLRLARYLGQAVDSQAIETRLLEALDQLAYEQSAPWLAVAHFETGAFYRRQNQLDQAELHYERAHSIYVSLNDSSGVAASSNSLGLVAWRTGRLDQAWEYFEDALALRERLGDDYQIASVANNIGLLLTQLGESQQALDYYELALELFQGPIDLRRQVDVQRVRQQLSNVSGVADLPAALNTLNNMAVLERETRRPDLAERYWRNYLALEGHVPRATAVAEARVHLGRMLLRQGRLDEALRLLIEAHARFESADAKRWMAVSSIVLSKLYAKLGDLETAVRYASSAVEAAADDANVQADARRMLGELYRLRGSHEEALNQLERASQLFRSSQSTELELATLSEKVWIDFLLGNAETALFEQQEIHNRLLLMNSLGPAAVVLSRIGEIHAALNRYDQARSSLEQALGTHRNTGDTFSELETLERLGRLLHAIDREAAIEFNERAIELIETIYESELPALRQAEFLAASRSVFDRQVDALLHFGRVEQAWRVADAARARSLRDLRHVQKQRRNTPRRLALLDERAEQVERLLSFRLQETGRPSDADQALVIRRALDRIESEMRQLAEPDHDRVSPSDLATIQNKLRDHQILLSYYLGQERAVVWIIQSNHFEWKVLERSSQLDALVGDLISHLRHPRHGLGAIEEAAAELRSILLDPAKDRLTAGSDVFIQPDGILHSLPFVLLTPNVGGREETLLPTLTQVLTTSQFDSSDTSELASRSVVIMADPGWRTSPTASPIFPDQSLLGRLIRNQALASLPGTRREAEAIAGLASDGGVVRLRLGTDATRDFILDGGLSDHTYVHLATHGLIDLDYPMLSSLLLAADQALGPAFLRPHEIAELDLDADLVVLSGCETGHGKVLAGEGTLSLARPFLIAGARQVLSSLWKIDDHRTAEFMQRFYQHLLNDGDSAARALSRAQNWMRRQPGTTHPYYWAGFILIRA